MSPSLNPRWKQHPEQVQHVKTVGFFIRNPIRALRCSQYERLKAGVEVIDRSAALVIGNAANRTTRRCSAIRPSALPA